MVTDFVFVELAGDPPSDSGLDALRSFAGTFSLIVDALKRVLGEVSITRIGHLDDLDGVSPFDSTRIIYLMGHAWLVDGIFSVSMLSRDGASEVLSGNAIVNLLKPAFQAPSVFLLVDTCHSRALEPWLEAIGCDCVAVFSSGAEEQTYELPLDKATHFCITVSKALHQLSKEPSLDPIAVAVLASREARRDKTSVAPTIDYLLRGRPFRLPTKNDTDLVRRSLSRTSRIRRTILLAAGAISAIALLVSGGLYWQMWMLEIHLNGVASE